MVYTLPDPAPVVTAVELAARLGFQSPNRAVIAMLDGAVEDAISDVETYLGRPIMPRLFTETGRSPHGPAEYGGWNLVGLADPFLGVTQVTSELLAGVPTGLYTVEYAAGLNCTEPDKRPILRYVKAAAMNAPEVVRMWQALPSSRTAVTNVAAEGQSITYATGSLGGGGDAGSMSPGALPTLASLDRWRIAGRRVFVRKGQSADWPYDGAWGGSWLGY